MLIIRLAYLLMVQGIQDIEKRRISIPVELIFDLKILNKESRTAPTGNLPTQRLPTPPRSPQPIHKMSLDT